MASFLTTIGWLIVIIESPGRSGLSNSLRSSFTALSFFLRRSLLFRLGGLIADVVGVESILAESTVKASDSASLLDSLEAFNLGLVDIYDFSRSDLVDLMEVTNSALDQLDEDKSLDNGVSSAADLNLLVVVLGEEGEGIAEIVLNLALCLDLDDVLWSFFFSFSVV